MVGVRGIRMVRGADIGADPGQKSVLVGDASGRMRTWKTIPCELLCLRY